MEKAEPSLSLLTGQTHLSLTPLLPYSLTHPAIMPAPINKTIPLLPWTLTVYFRLSFHNRDINSGIPTSSHLVVFCCLPLLCHHSNSEASTSSHSLLEKKQDKYESNKLRKWHSRKESAQQQKLGGSVQVCHRFGSVH